MLSVRYNEWHRYNSKATLCAHTYVFILGKRLKRFDISIRSARIRLSTWMMRSLFTVLIAMATRRMCRRRKKNLNIEWQHECCIHRWRIAGDGRYGMPEKSDKSITDVYIFISTLPFIRCSSSSSSSFSHYRHLHISLLFAVVA